MSSRDRFTDEEWSALALGPASAAGAMMATSHPGLLGIVKEMHAGLKAIKEEAPSGPAGELVRELIGFAEAHDDLGKSLETGGDDSEAIRAAALETLDQSGAAAAKLSPEELDGYVGWLVGVASSMAEAASDRGESVSVSDAESQTLSEIERRLRRE